MKEEGKIIHTRTILKRIIVATLFVVGVSFGLNAPSMAIQRVVPQTTTATARTVTNRTPKSTTPARTAVSRATTNRASAQRVTASTTQNTTTTVATKSTTPKTTRTATQTRAIAPKSADSATRRYKSSNQSRTQSRATTLKPAPGFAEGNNTLIKMHIPDDLRSKPNIAAYMKLFGTEAESEGYIVFKLLQNKLPNLSTFFTNLGGSLAAYAENNTNPGTQKVGPDGTWYNKSDRDIYLQHLPNIPDEPTANDLKFTRCKTDTDCPSDKYTGCNYGVCVKKYADQDGFSFTCNSENIQPVFAIKVKPTDAKNSGFIMKIHAKGTFFLFAPQGGVVSNTDTTSCGMPTIIKLERTTASTSGELYATIDPDKEITLYFGGVATEYPNDDKPVVEFINNVGFNYRPYIYEVSGSIGALFPTIGDGNNLDYTKQPRFKDLFKDATNLKYIPAGLFDGVHGQPVADMFSGVFSGCTGLTGSIPDRLFAGLTGTEDRLFASTFYNCSGLTGLIPANLFDGLTGPYQQRMFFNTFGYCSGLTGNIPDGLFGNLTINDPLAYTSQTFGMTFEHCSGLTGYVPSSMYKGLNEKDVSSTFGTNGDAFSGCTNMATSCENGYIKDPAAANYEKYWSNHVACIPDGSSSPTPPACPEDCGAGTCNSSSNGTCNCFEHATKVVNSYKCECESGFKLNDTNTACVADTGGQRKSVRIQFSTDNYQLGDDNTEDPITTPASYTIDLAQTYNNATGEVNIDWGDTKSDTVNAGEAMPSHTYENSGIFNVTLTGDNIPTVKSTEDNVITTCTGNADEIRINETQCTRAKFTINTTSDANEFLIYIGAAGTFYIDWGDGSAPFVITHKTPKSVPYSHKYTTTQSRAIRIGGLATAYPPLDINPAISFFYNNISHPNYIHSVSGSLGELFPSYGTDTGQTPRFRNTFLYATNMYTIPNTLFSGISNGSGTVAPISSMFEGTFKNSGLTEIPTGLFAEIGGAPANSMFGETFYMAENLAGEIPSDLFAGISGAPAEKMYDRTFGSTKLSGKLPDYLFGNLNGAPQYAMFLQTFANDTGLTGRIPDHLFGDLTGSIDVRWAFYETFKGCTGLTGYIPSTLFGTVTGDAGDGTFSNTFTGTSLDTTCNAGLHPYATYNNRFATYWDGHIACESDDALPDDPNLIDCTGAENEIAVGDDKCITSPFHVTTNSVNQFRFSISAAGIFYYDCGDGKGGHVINRTDNTEPQTYYCNYDTTGEYTVRFAGKATGYSTNEQNAAIGFSVPRSDTSNVLYCDVNRIYGSLGAIFGSIDNGGNGNTPRFYATFANCGPKRLDNNWTIPETLFNGINGAPISYMFYETFSGIHNANSNNFIPANLFSGIQGAPAPYMFAGTFSGNDMTSGSIPAGLFAGISGAPAKGMFKETFAGFASYKYNGDYWRNFSIPEDLFYNISGAPAESMFEGTFRGSGLTNLPPSLFKNISGAPAAKMFSGTFNDCAQLKTNRSASETFVNSDFFGNIRGESAADMFSHTFEECQGITGTIPPNLFGGQNLTGEPEQGVFSSTFKGCSGLTGEIPDYLLGRLSGDAQPWAFSSTFYGCSGLTGMVPEHLFSGVTSDLNMSFTYTFSDTGITGIHENLFSGLNRLTTNMLHSTFENCTKLTEIPANLFASLNGKSAGDANRKYYNGKTNEYSIGDIFEDMFKGCTGLTSLPDKLFAGITGTVAGMFWGTFAGCTGITSIPENLFYDATTGMGISGAPTERMFKETFMGCTGLTEIPAGLFAGISGAPAKYMYSGTFQGCTGLTHLPKTMLFGDISGSPAEYMFQNTFMGCTGLTSLPEAPLFGIIGPQSSESNGIHPLASHMFSGTFWGDTSLAGFIPAQMFWRWDQDKYQDSRVTDMFSRTFMGTQLQSVCPVGYKKFVTNFEELWGWTDGNVRPGGYRVACEPECTSNADCGDGVCSGTETHTCVCPTTGSVKENNTCSCLAGYTYNPQSNTCTKPTCSDGQILNTDGKCIDSMFNATLTTTTASETFGFSINSLDGQYVIDWGDGGDNTLANTKNANNRYDHVYANAGEYTVRIARVLDPTGYAYGESNATISFNGNTQLTAVSGSLGKLFPVLNDGTGTYDTPHFERAFMNCTNLKFIGSDLFHFDGIQPAPIANMFKYTFWGCTNLTEFIPPELFSTIDSNVSVGEDTFKDTFVNSGLAKNTCPSGYKVVSTAFSDYFTPYVSCETGCANNSDCTSGVCNAGVCVECATDADCGTGTCGTDRTCTCHANATKNNGTCACNAGYYLNNGSCTACSSVSFTNTCTIANGTGSQTCYRKTSPVGATNSSQCTGEQNCETCTVDSCNTGFINIGNACVECTTNADCGLGTCGTNNTCTCVANATKNNGKCTCDANYYLNNGACTACSSVSFSKSCSIANGTGSQTCYRKTSQLGATDASQCTGEQNCETCTVVSCDAGFMNIDNTCVEPKIEITTTNDTEAFAFSISAKGTYYVDWGDGTTQKITHTTNDMTEKLHNYPTKKTYTIRMGGTATGYSTYSYPAIEFNRYPLNLKTISGSLAAMFPVIGNGGWGNTPLFNDTFYSCSNLQSIPYGLFDFGKPVQPVKGMFSATFRGCSGLKSIPAGLFASLSGAPTENLFSITFEGCSGLSGAIPANLFGGLYGEPAMSMFEGTFKDCTKLQGTIPDGLFGNLSGSPTTNMFNATFSGCVGLEGYVPSSMYRGITSGTNYSGMYSNAFYKTRIQTGTCPSGTTADPYAEPFLQYWDGHIACISN